MVLFVLIVHFDIRVAFLYGIILMVVGTLFYRCCFFCYFCLRDFTLN